MGPSSTPGLWLAVQAFLPKAVCACTWRGCLCLACLACLARRAMGVRVSVNAAGLLVQWAARHPGRLGNGRLQWRLSWAPSCWWAARRQACGRAMWCWCRAPWVGGRRGSPGRVCAPAAGRRGCLAAAGRGDAAGGLAAERGDELAPAAPGPWLAKRAGPDLGQLSALSLGELAARTSPESGDAPVCLLQAQGLVASDGLAWLRWLLAPGLPANPTLADLVAGLPLEMTLSGGHDGQRPGPTDHAGSAEPRSGLHRLAGTPPLDAISQVAAPGGHAGVAACGRRSAAPRPGLGGAC